MQKVVYKGVTHDNPESVADAFSNYFFKIFSEKHSSSCCNLQRSNHSFFLFPVSPDDVSTAIKSLKETGPGINKISARHLKLAVDIISEPLSIIINLAFKHGSFPTSLKIAKVLPIFKKGDKQSISNYRPICILSSLSKVIEKLLITRLNKYLNKFNILKPCQFGFRAGSSTNLAILSLSDFIKHSIDAGFVVGSVFLDFTKAFDTINHVILSKKLESYGITGPSLKFLNSYLLNRKHTVYISGSFSSTKTINQGVPQGSLLGPLLFFTLHYRPS